MDFIVAANTDVGFIRRNNQDSLSVKVVKTRQGRMVFAALCDGMGGLAKGELASATVIRAFDDWLMKELPLLCENPLEDEVISRRWENIVAEQNDLIKHYGMEHDVKLGTTAVIMLLSQEQYYILNVGDSRAYEICDDICQITEDHSYVAREVARGNMTWDEAKVHKKRNVLLQCIGAGRTVRPDIFVGKVKKNAVFMLCSDGFWHMITPEEMSQELNYEAMSNAGTIQHTLAELTDLCKQRGETDNISVVLVKTV